MSSEGRYASDAMPLLARTLVREGRVSEVLASVRTMWTSLQVDSEVTVANLETRLELATSILVGTAEAIAGEGYMAEAFALVDEAPMLVAEAERVRDLRLRLAAASERGPKAEVELALSALGESPSELAQRLKVAQLLLSSGDPEGAKEIAQPLVSNGDFKVAYESLRILIAAGLVGQDMASIEKLTKEFIKSRPDKVAARNVAADALMYVADDKRAIALKTRNLDLVPTDSMIRQTMVAAIHASDMKLFEKAVQKYWRISDEPMGDVYGFMANSMFSHRPEVLEGYLGPYRSVFPGVWATRSASVQMQYRMGQPEEARDEILNFLEEVEFEPLAVESVLEMLHELRLWGEIARVVAPRLDLKKVTVESVMMVGRALLQLGDKDGALQLLDRYVESAPDPVRAAGRLSHTLVSEGFDNEALRYAEMAVSSRPGRNLSYAFRAHARLALGDAAGAEDAQRALGAGVGRQIFLYRFGRASLRSGLNKLADEYLTELALSPSTPEQEIQSLRFALDAYSSEKKYAEGVAFLEKHWPRIAAGDGATGAALLPSLAGLYEAAGMQERSFSLYETGILRERVASPFDASLNTYRNNLAYTYSTTNKNVDQGVELIRLAIASDRKRNASFIDTLGWLKFRQGDLKEAEQRILQSLGSASGGASEMEELYEHLAEIKHKQGHHYEAVWIDIYLDSIRRR